MTDWLVKRFIKDTGDRGAFGKLAGAVGIVCNLILFAGKLLAGVITGSIAVLADAVNNLSDASANIVSLIGFKLAAKPPDKKHPYGYARYEYLAGLTVSAMILAIGISLGKESVSKLIHPDKIDFNYLSVGILTASIGIKLWLSHFNGVLGKRIDSDTLKATAADSRNDVISTAAVLLSMIIGHKTGFLYMDGIMGIAVAAFIIYSGIELIRETLSPLLGESPSEELVRHIEAKVLSYPEVLGIHDLMVHDYGPGHKFASLHVEMAAETEVMLSHDIIDNIEENFLKEDGIQVSIHFDPIITADNKVGELRKIIAAAIHCIDPDFSIHDFRIVEGPTHTNVLFDLVLPAGYKGNIEELIANVQDIIKGLDSKYIPKIKIEQSYT